jgi:hypothetical protein
MDMRVIEAGNNAAPFQVHNLCLWTSQFENGFAVTDPDDSISLDGNRLRFRLLWIFRPDLAVN